MLMSLIHRHPRLAWPLSLLSALLLVMGALLLASGA